MKKKAQVRIKSMRSRTEREGLVGKAGGFLLLLFYFVLGIGGIARAFLSTFDITAVRGIFYLWLVLCCLFFAVVYQRKLWMKAALPTAGVLYLFMLWQQFGHIREGIFAAANAVIDRVNPYYRVNILRFSAEQADETYFSIAFLMCLFPLIALLGYEMVRCIRCYMYAAVAAIPIVVALLVGRVPDFASMLMILVSFLGILAASGKDAADEQREFVRQQIKAGERHADAAEWDVPGLRRQQLHTIAGMGVLLLLALGVTWLFVRPLVDRRFDGAKEAIVKLQQQAREQEGIFAGINALISSGDPSGIGSGELGNTDGFGYTGATALEVTTREKPNETVYLKGYVGSTYTGNAWKAPGESDLDAYAQENGWYIGGSTGQEINNLFYLHGAALQQALDGGEEPHEITIRRKKASADYTYFPYMAFDDGTYTAYGDAYLLGQKQQTATFQYYPQSLAWRILQQSDLLIQPEENGDLGAEYQAYVYQTYLDVPEDRLPHLKAQMDAQEFGSLPGLITYIQTTLANTAVYDINVGKCPQDKEYTEYFLYEQRAGYCSHFATAATLMFRMRGIPARYVTGYIAQEDDFKRDDDGTYTALVKDSKAHAWTEIYLDQVGWVAIEATPGYTDGTDPTAAAAAAAAAAATDGAEGTEPRDPAAATDSTQQEKPAAAGQAEKDGTNSTKNGTGKTIRLRTVLGWLSGAAAVLVLVILIRRFWISMRRRRSFSVQNPNRAVRNIFYDLYEVLAFSGFPPDLECTDPQFLPAVEEAYPDLEKGEFSTFLGDVLQANFGADRLNAQSAIQARQIYRKVSQEAYQRLRWPKKVEYWLIKAFL